MDALNNSRSCTEKENNDLKKTIVDLHREIEIFSKKKVQTQNKVLSSENGVLNRDLEFLQNLNQALSKDIETFSLMSKQSQRKYKELENEKMTLEQHLRQVILISKAEKEAVHSHNVALQRQVFQLNGNLQDQKNFLDTYNEVQQKNRDLQQAMSKLEVKFKQEKDIMMQQNETLQNDLDHVNKVLQELKVFEQNYHEMKQENVKLKLKLDDEE